MSQKAVRNVLRYVGSWLVCLPLFGFSGPRRQSSLVSPRESAGLAAVAFWKLQGNSSSSLSVEIITITVQEGCYHPLVQTPLQEGENQSLCYKVQAMVDGTLKEGYYQVHHERFTETPPLRPSIEYLLEEEAKFQKHLRPPSL